MNVAFQYASGGLTFPGLAFSDERSSGFYYAGSGDLRTSVTGEAAVRFVADAAGPGLQRPVMIHNGSAFQPIMKGDSSETPVFGEITVDDSLTIGAGGLTVDAGGLSIPADDLDITGNVSVDGNVTANTINNSSPVARALVEVQNGILTIFYEVGIASVVRNGVGIYRVTFDAPLVSIGGKAFCLCSIYAQGSTAYINYQTVSANVIDIFTVNWNFDRIDTGFTIFALLETS
jgi:hypothetical protein